MVYYVHSLFLHKWGSKYLLYKQWQLISSFERWNKILNSSSIFVLFWSLKYENKRNQTACGTWCINVKWFLSKRKDGGKFKVTLWSSFFVFASILAQILPRICHFFLLISIVNSTAVRDLHNSHESVRKRLMERHSRKDTAFLVISSTPSGFKESSSCLQVVPYNFILVFQA